jgi:hypothetical protein
MEDVVKRDVHVPKIETRQLLGESGARYNQRRDTIRSAIVSLISEWLVMCFQIIGDRAIGDSNTVKAPLDTEIATETRPRPVALFPPITRGSNVRLDS